MLIRNCYCLLTPFYYFTPTSSRDLRADTIPLSIYSCLWLASGRKPNPARRGAALGGISSPMFVTDPEGLALLLNSLPKGITLCLVNTQASQNGLLLGYHWWAVALKRANDRPPREPCVINMS